MTIVGSPRTRLIIATHGPHCTGWAAQRDVKYVCGWLENENQNGENNVFGIIGNEFKIIFSTQDRVK